MIPYGNLQCPHMHVSDVERTILDKFEVLSNLTYQNTHLFLIRNLYKNGTEALEHINNFDRQMSGCGRCFIDVKNTRECLRYTCFGLFSDYS